MLGYWRTHKDYQEFVVKELSIIALTNPYALFEYQDTIEKLFVLDLDKLKDIILPLYPPIGRPAQVQPEIFRSFILMNHLGFNLDNWPLKLKYNPILCTIAGFTPDNLVQTASYYDFINRIINLDERTKLKKTKKKPRKKLKKGEKLPPKHPNVVSKLVKKILRGKTFGDRSFLTLQKIFAKVCVGQSVKLGLLPKTLSISGDGTCILTGASSYGVKVCKCNEQGKYHCTCPRKFPDPNATWGWDSHNERYFYGYTGYFISTYNKSLKVDLPLHLRLVQASRHDSVSAVVALAEFRELYPDLIVDTFISDSASDNYATYELLHFWNINAVIALNSKNKGNFKYPPALNIDTDGVPICPGGHRMVYYGISKNDRCRLKYRCPRVLGKVSACEACNDCSPSKYGRVIYTKPDWDLRLFTTIPRNTAAFKLKMNERTAAERVNNRILNNYGIENSKTRGKKRISFFVTIAAFNVHLDAQIKKLKADKNFDFYKIFNIPIAA